MVIQQGVHAAMKTVLGHFLSNLETALAADVVSIIAPIFPGLEQTLRVGVDMIPAAAPRRPRLAVVLHTEGGVVEIVARMVQTIRAHYQEVWFIVPDKAMSAGTIFAMSGDEILMDSFSVLGPIDPQVEKKIDGEIRLVPALAYVTQYKRFIKKSANGTLTTAEFELLRSFDLGELQRFQEAVELSVDLIKDWLPRYKFKNWSITEGKKAAVTAAMKEKRAEEIARQLSKHTRWHSHGRGLSMETLTADPPRGLNLRIRDFGSDAALAPAIRIYYDHLRDWVGQRGGAPFVHTRGYF